MSVSKFLLTALNGHFFQDCISKIEKLNTSFFNLKKNIFGRWLLVKDCTPKKAKQENTFFIGSLTFLNFFHIVLLLFFSSIFFLVLLFKHLKSLRGLLVVGFVSSLVSQWQNCLRNSPDYRGSFKISPYPALSIGLCIQEPLPVSLRRGLQAPLNEEVDMRNLVAGAHLLQCFNHIIYSNPGGLMPI